VSGYPTLDRLLTLGPADRKTWRYDTGPEHWQIVDCRAAAELGQCPVYADGHVVVVPDEEAQEARATFVHYGYVFMKVDSRRPGWTAFMFPPEQPCFPVRSGKLYHRVRREEVPARLLVMPGDHRGNPRGEPALVHSGPDAWMSHLHEHVDALYGAAQREPGPAAGSPLPLPPADVTESVTKPAGESPAGTSESEG
jgi:hypothetical protein